MSALQVFRDWIEAMNRHDAAAFAALYAPNAVVRDPAYPEPLEGRDAIQADVEAFLRAFPDLHATAGTQIEGDGRLAVETGFTATHQGPLIGPSGEIPPTGRRVEFKTAGFSRLDGQGRILEENRYYDFAGLLTQLEVAV
jgi:steroid delta-isomerase-like uncharacterized protein